MNINGIRTQTRVEMLKVFVRTHEFHIVLVQELTAPECVEIPGYVSHINIGSEMRGTTILVRKEILTNIDPLPSGRAIAAVYCGIK
jgi:exonuclease III